MSNLTRGSRISLWLSLFYYVCVGGYQDFQFRTLSVGFLIPKETTPREIVSEMTYRITGMCRTWRKTIAYTLFLSLLFVLFYVCRFLCCFLRNERWWWWWWWWWYSLGHSERPWASTPTHSCGCPGACSLILYFYYTAWARFTNWLYTGVREQTYNTDIAEGVIKIHKNHK